MKAKCKNEEITSSMNKNEEWSGVSPFEQNTSHISGQMKQRKDQNFTLDHHLSRTIQRYKRRIIKKRNSYHSFIRKIEEKSDLIDNLEKLWPEPIFDILNLVPNPNSKRPFNESLRYNAQYLPNLLPKIALKSGLLQPDNHWKVIGNITSENSTLNSITFITGSAGDRVIGPGASSKHNFR